MVGYFVNNTLSPSGGVNRGICTVNENGFLENIKETKGITSENIDPNAIVSMNLFGFQNKEYVRFCFEKYWNLFLTQQSYLDNSVTASVGILWATPHGRSYEPSITQYSSREFMLPEIIQHILENNLEKIKVLATNDKWVGLTYKEDKEFVDLFFKKNTLSED
jgi:hypothetical protein